MIDNRPVLVMKQPLTCKFGTIQVSEHGLTKVNGNRYAVAVMADFDLTKDHYDAIKVSLQAYSAFEKIAQQQRRGFILVLKDSYTDKNECAQQVTSFLLNVTERLDKPVKRKHNAPGNSPYNNAATRAAHSIEMPYDVYSRRAARR